VSLNAHEEHRAMIFNLEIAPDGTVVNRSVEQAKIKSRAQLTYENVSKHLEHGADLATDDHGKPVPAEVREQMKLFEELGSVLMKKADARGVVEPERREMQIALDGEHFFLKERHDEYASKLNAQLSILTNVAGAEAFDEPGLDVPAIFKAHDAPWPSKLRGLGEKTDAIVLAHHLPTEWKWKRRESLAEWVDRLQTLPKNDHERGIARALQMQVISIQVPAQFVNEPRPHEGLKLARYGRFTAPMREAVGLMSHALLAQLERWRAFHRESGQPKDPVLWQNMMLGAVVDPAKLSPERRAQVERALALDGKGLTALTPEERKLVDDAIAEAINAGNRAGQKQGQVDGASRRLLFDDLFRSDLGDPQKAAPIRTGTLMQVADNQVRVQLEDPLVEVKLEVKGQISADGAQITVDGKTYTIGGEARIQATFHDGEKLHFALAT
jgi:ribonuclease R